MNNISDFPKQQNNQKRKKRKVRKSFLLVVCILIITVLIILSTTVMFPINEISVNYKGGRYTSSQILSASGDKVGDNFFMLSKQATEASICEKLPYIKSVDVEKKFPDKIILTPNETEAAYCIKVSEGYLLADRSLKPLEITKAPATKLCYIEGVKLMSYELGKSVEWKSTEREQCLNKIAKAAKKRGYSLDYIELSSVSDIKIRVNGRFDITLGTTKQIDEKLDFMAKMISEIEKKNKSDKGKIDLSYFPTKKEGYFTRGELSKLTYGEKAKS